MRHHKQFILLSILFLFFAVFFAIASFPTLFWHLRPARLNAETIKFWIQQKEPLSQKQLNILRMIVVEDYCPKGKFQGCVLDVLNEHMHQQEDSIVEMLLFFIRNCPSVKQGSLSILRNVSEKNKSKVIEIYREQLVNDEFRKKRQIEISSCIDYLASLDPRASREFIANFTKDSDETVALHASFVLDQIDQ